MEKFAQNLDSSGADLESVASIEATRQAMKLWETWLAVTYCAALLLALFLLIGGIGLVSRRRYGVNLTRMWSWLKIPHVLGVTVLTYLMNEDTVRLTKELAEGAPGPVPEQMMEMITYVVLAITWAWGMALPIFVLIWYARAKVKAEVATWD
jgi:hypothetical protein